MAIGTSASSIRTTLRSKLSGLGADQAELIARAVADVIEKNNYEIEAWVKREARSASRRANSD